MDRPNWNKLQKVIDENKLSKLVVWRLDRLGRTASGLTKLFDEFIDKKITLVSIREGIDLSKPSGRLIARVMASVANYEIEVGSERIRAGQAVARASGKRWGGSKKGRLNTITIEQVKAVVRMKAAGEKISVICRTLSMNKPSVYRVLRRVESGDIKLSA